MTLTLNPDGSLEFDLAGRLNRQRFAQQLAKLTNAQLHQLTLALVELDHNLQSAGKEIFREQATRAARTHDTHPSN